MKKNKKYDKVIANFDLDFIKNKFDNDNVTAPESLNGENVKNAIDNKEQTADCTSDYRLLSSGMG